MTLERLMPFNYLKWEGRFHNVLSELHRNMSELWNSFSRTKKISAIISIVGCVLIVGLITTVTVVNRQQKIHQSSTESNQVITPTNIKTLTGNVQPRPTSARARRRICGRHLIRAVAQACSLHQVGSRPLISRDKRDQGFDYGGPSKHSSGAVPRGSDKRTSALIPRRRKNPPVAARSTLVLQMVARFCCQRGCDEADIAVLIDC